MTELPRLRGQQLITALQRAGFQVIRVKGSHHFLRHPDGRCTIVPVHLVDLATRDEVKRTGIYILAGEDPDNPAQEVVYIGESENVWKRLAQHNADPSKDFWRRTVIITSKDENLTKGHVRYLESRLIQIAAQAQRAQLANGNNPETSSLPEPDVADMEYFLEQIQMLLPVLGLSFALPLPTLSKVQDAQRGVQIESPIFHLTSGGVDAYAQEINGEFVVFKDSTARKVDTPSLTDTYRQMRRNLLNEGKSANSPNPEYWVFTQNVPFTSPSTAANVASGTRLNGRALWKLKDSDQTYAQWLESQIREVEPLAEENE